MYETYGITIKKHVMSGSCIDPYIQHLIKPLVCLWVLYISTFTTVCNIHYDVNINDHTTDTINVLSPSTKHSNTNAIYTGYI